MKQQLKKELKAEIEITREKLKKEETLAEALKEYRFKRTIKEEYHYISTLDKNELHDLGEETKKSIEKLESKIQEKEKLLQGKNTSPDKAKKERK
jgi:hypothetical protein